MRGGIMQEQSVPVFDVCEIQPKMSFRGNPNNRGLAMVILVAPRDKSVAQWRFEKASS